MSEQEYQTLWNYSEQLSRDKIQRSELITFAFMQQKKLGGKCTLGLQKSIMHFRGKEINKRSVFPAKEVGKRTIDAWNRPERIYLDKPRSSEDTNTIGDVVLNTKTTPLDFAITNDFLNSLSDQEKIILEELNGETPRQANRSKTRLVERASVSLLRIRDSLYES